MKTFVPRLAALPACATTVSDSLDAAPGNVPFDNGSPCQTSRWIAHRIAITSGPVCIDAVTVHVVAFDALQLQVCGTSRVPPAAAPGGIAPWGRQALALPFPSMDTVARPDAPGPCGGRRFAGYGLIRATSRAQRIVPISPGPDCQLSQSTQNRCTPGQATLKRGDSNIVGVNALH
jgi:hypothetical protein